MRTMKRTVARTGVLAVAGAALIAACSEREKLYEVEGDPIFQSPVDVAQATGLPNGTLTLDRYKVIDYDLSVPDAFGRATTSASGLYGHQTGTASGNYWGIALHTRAQDPRLPALTAVEASGGGAAYIGGPDAWMDPGEFNFWFDGTVVGVPGTRYVAALARYAVVPRGELDHVEILLNGTITLPDSLVLVDPNPGGSVELGDNFSGPCRDLEEAQETANPLFLGSTIAEDDGSVLLDLNICSGLWYASGLAIDQTDKTPIAPNVNKPFRAPQFNYIVWYEMDADGNVLLDRPLVRRQVAPDLTVDGSGIVNNAMAPFPTARATTEQLLAGPGFAGAPDSLTLQVYHLGDLGSKVYHAWLYNNLTGEVVPAPGNWVVEEEIRRVTDAGDVVIEYETVTTANGTAAVPGAGGGGVFRHTFRTSDALLNGDSIHRYTHLLVSIENGPGAGRPSAEIPLWRQFADKRGTDSNYFDDAFLPGTIAFGTFRLDALPYIYEPRGTAKADFHGGNLRIVAEQLSRPPVGYYYAAWLVNESTGALAYLGPLTSPPPGSKSLFDADVDSGLPGVTADGIVRAAVTVSESSIGGKFYDFNTIRVTLEPKASPGKVPAPTIILAGPVPDPLLQQRPGNE